MWGWLTFEDVRIGVGMSNDRAAIDGQRYLQNPFRYPGESKGRMTPVFRETWSTCVVLQRSPTSPPVHASCIKDQKLRRWIAASRRGGEFLEVLDPGVHQLISGVFILSKR